MYNGIGLGTARGSGTNGYVQRNISAIRKTKEKIPEYHEKEDNAVRPFDPELVEHERRRQAEVRCMELRDLLEEQDVPEADIDKKVNDFRNKLLAEKKLSYQRDSSGRAIVKDSHEFSVAQEQKNTRAKDAFGIREDFVPGQSMEGKKFGESKELQEKAAMEASIPFPSIVEEKLPEKAKKRKKSHKRSRKSSSSSDSSSDDESRRKKRKKEKKKKSKKSHRHNRKDSSKQSHKTSENKESNNHNDDEEIDGNSNVTKTALATPSTCCISIATSGSSSSDSNHSDDKGNEDSKYSLSVLDFSGHHKYYPSLPTIPKSNGKLSPVEAFQRTCIPLLASVVEPSLCHSRGLNAIHHNRNHHHHHRSRSGSSNSKSSTRSCSRSITRLSKSRSVSRSISRSPHHGSISSRSRSKSFEKISSKSRSRSRSKSRSRSRSRSHSSKSSRSHSPSSKSSSSSRSRSHSPTESVRSAASRSPSIPRRRGSSPSFMERRRITSSRKRPIPYKRKDAVEWNVSSSSDSDD